jgi:hypothetical protein
MNPRRAGSLERDKPTSSGTETLRRGHKVVRARMANLERGGVVKASPFQRRGKP